MAGARRASMLALQLFVFALAAQSELGYAEVAQPALGSETLPASEGPQDARTEPVDGPALVEDETRPKLAAVQGKKALASKACCSELHARCLACAQGLTVRAFCLNVANKDIDGCRFRRKSTKATEQGKKGSSQIKKGCSRTTGSKGSNKAGSKAGSKVGAKYNRKQGKSKQERALEKRVAVANLFGSHVSKLLRRVKSIELKLKSKQKVRRCSSRRKLAKAKAAGIYGKGDDAKHLHRRLAFINGVNAQVHKLLQRAKSMELALKSKQKVRRSSSRRKLAKTKAAGTQGKEEDAAQLQRRLAFIDRASAQIRKLLQRFRLIAKKLGVKPAGSSCSKSKVKAGSALLQEEEAVDQQDQEVQQGQLEQELAQAQAEVEAQEEQLEDAEAEQDEESEDEELEGEEEEEKEEQAQEQEDEEVEDEEEEDEEEEEEEEDEETADQHEDEGDLQQEQQHEEEAEKQSDDAGTQ